MKPDADEILAFIDRLGREPWLGQQRDRLAIKIQLLGCTAYEGELTEREVF